MVVRPEELEAARLIAPSTHQLVNFLKFPGNERKAGGNEDESADSVEMPAL